MWPVYHEPTSEVLIYDCPTTVVPTHLLFTYLLFPRFYTIIQVLDQSRPGATTRVYDRIVLSLACWAHV